jgi:hypothetical protein
MTVQAQSLTLAAPILLDNRVSLSDEAHNDVKE